MGKNIIGIVLPTSQEHAKRILGEQKNILVKKIAYIPKELGEYRLKKGMKVLLYISGSGRKLAGEAEIANIEFLTAKEIAIKYSESLMISKQELDNYVGNSPHYYKKPLLVLTLTKIQDYKEEVKYQKSISLSGEYLTKDVYDSIKLSIHSIY